MSSDWEQHRLSEVLSIKHGYAFPGDGFTDDRRLPTLVTPGNFRIGGGFQPTKTKTFHGEYAGQFLLVPGDVIVTMTDLSRNADTLGYSAIVPNDGRNYLHNQRIGKVVVTTPEKVDSTFVAYLLRMRQYRDFVVGTASGSTVKHTSPSRIESYVAGLPPLPEQRRIAAVLGALDDLVETNQIAAASIRLLAITALDAASRVGDVVPFSEIAVQIRDGATGEGLAAGTPYLGLEHFGTDGVGLTGVGDASNVDSNKSRFRSGDVLYGKLRPYFRKVDRPGFDGVCSTELWVLRPQAGWGAATLNAVVARPDFTEFAMAGNTGTRMPRANWAHVARAPVPVPPRPQREVLDQRLDELWRAGVELSEEAAELTRTRDELLPLLMSGRVRVADIEAA